jgi:hypothetical protein
MVWRTADHNGGGRRICAFLFCFNHNFTCGFVDVYRQTCLEWHIRNINHLERSSGPNDEQLVLSILIINILE